MGGVGCEGGLPSSSPAQATTTAACSSALHSTRPKAQPRCYNIRALPYPAPSTPIHSSRLAAGRNILCNSRTSCTGPKPCLHTARISQHTLCQQLTARHNIRRKGLPFLAYFFPIILDTATDMRDTSRTPSWPLRHMVGEGGVAISALNQH